MKKLSVEDRLATYAELTARSIAENYQRYLPKTPEKVFLCGGGAKNCYLIERLRYHLPKSEVLTTEEIGWPVSAIEGGSFALLAALRLWGVPIDLKSITGAKKPVLLGQII